LQIADCFRCSIAVFADTRNNRAASRLAQYHRPNIGASPSAGLMQLGRNHCAAIKRKTLDEERTTDQRLTSRAEGKVDIGAAR
jgi:hypothetical protein